LKGDISLAFHWLRNRPVDVPLYAWLLLHCWVESLTAHVYKEQKDNKICNGVDMRSTYSGYILTTSLSSKQRDCFS